MIGFADDLLDGFLLDEELVNDDRFVGKCGAHVMDGASAGNHFMVIELPLANVFAGSGWGDLEQDADFCQSEAALLLFCFKRNRDLG